MSEAPKRIWAWDNRTTYYADPSIDNRRVGVWQADDPEDAGSEHPGTPYILASQHDAELKAALDTHAAITAKLSEVARQRDAALGLLRRVYKGTMWADIPLRDEVKTAIAAAEGGQDAEG